jgi:CBS domain-containing protein
MKVRDLMLRKVATTDPEERLDRAVQRMNERNCGALPVVDEEYRVLAMVTDRDICLSAWRADAKLSELRVRDAMSKTVVSCRPEDPLEEAERLMSLNQVRRLPVVDARGRLEGLLPLEDLAREARRERDLIVPLVTNESVGRTLGEISRARLVREGGAQ